MFVGFDWLREFVPFEGEPQVLADRLTMLGLEVEGAHDPFAPIRDAVVGQVLECGRHPEADKLSVCLVDVGGERLSIVCGAPNVAQCQKVPVSRFGATLPGGLVIKKAKLRGVESFGMICSERELGLSEGHEGIMVLPGSCRPGERLGDALQLESLVFNIGVTPNRADCLSVLGVAREAAMAFGLPLTLPKVNLAESGEPGEPGESCAELVRIEIPEPEYCPLYQARIIRGVSIGKSPDWLRLRLLSVGLRPINNIVDVTNLVLFEFGQPLHAFDRERLSGGVIRVARAADGMRLTTLDGQERALVSSDLLIWDADKPVALAGVMGGANSEIVATSREVLLECAVFRPGTVRRTARRLALPSEASYRFERGVDQVGSRLALDRAAALMAELSGGRVLSGVAANEPRPWVERVLPFRLWRCNSLLGLDLSPEFCRTSFTGLGCAVREASAEHWEVRTPSHRLDLEREVDLFEEAARIFGLDRIPAVLPRVPRTFDSPQAADTEYGFCRRLKRWGLGVGLFEAVNYSFVGQADLDLLGLPREGRIAVANPLSEDQDVMRTDLAPGLLANLRHNIAQGNARLKLFEVAKVFFADPGSETTAREGTRLAILLCGPRHAEPWPWPAEDADYLDVKGLVEHLLASLKLPPAEYAAIADHGFLDPCVAVRADGAELGRIGRVRPAIAEAFHARKEVWLADLDADLLRGRSRAVKLAFAPLAKFPPVRRDVTVMAPAALSAGEIERALREAKSPLLRELCLVAVYAPAATDERNLSFRLTYRHEARTLTDKEVDKEHARLLDGLARKLGVRF